MNKMSYLSVILFIIILFVGILNNKLILTFSYLYVFILSIINLFLWIYIEIKKTK